MKLENVKLIIPAKHILITSLFDCNTKKGRSTGARPLLDSHTDVVWFSCFARSATDESRKFWFGLAEYQTLDAPKDKERGLVTIEEAAQITAVPASRNKVQRTSTMHEEKL